MLLKSVLVLTQLYGRAKVAIRDRPQADNRPHSAYNMNFVQDTGLKSMLTVRPQPEVPYRLQPQELAKSVVNSACYVFCELHPFKPSSPRQFWSPSAVAAQEVEPLPLVAVPGYHLGQLSFSFFMIFSRFDCPAAGSKLGKALQAQLLRMPLHA